MMLPHVATSSNGMNRMTYDDALKLLRTGRFRELIGAFNEQAHWRHADLRSRTLFAYVLALTGQTSFASSVLGPTIDNSSATIRSQAEATLGIVKWWSGDHDAALSHLQTAVQHARESKNAEWIARTQLHLFRFAIDARPLDALTVILPRTREAVMRAGCASLTAYLHLCVATLEGYRGQIEEARRHCDLADSLLEADPNAWVSCGILINRGCIATLRCEFRDAAKFFRTAIQSAEVSGSTHMRSIAESNSAWVELVTGQFRKAEEALQLALTSSSQTGSRVAGLDLLARVHLAQGALDKAEEVLEPVMSGQPAQYSTYETRWAALTKAKLLFRRGESEDALRLLKNIRKRSNEIDDQYFTSARHLLAAYILGYTEKGEQCAHHILQADALGVTNNRDLQGQFNYSMGRIIAPHSAVFARALQERGKRIWATQGVISLPLEIGAVDELEPTRTEVRPAIRREDAVRSVINKLASLFDVAYSPHLSASELVEVLASVNALAPSFTETCTATSETMMSSTVNFQLGENRHGKKVIVTCGAPTNACEAVTLSDIFRISRAALELEKARREERKRAALWPSDPIEDQTGALYIAEEMHGLLDTARRVATANIPVLITGETGTGKEVLARLIHSYSPRAAKTFLPFNCSATPREMLDAQLFGHRRGAFTGATENFPGVIRAAAGGSLFLDEIGESTLEIQPKLLRFLESGEVHPIGETHPQRVDVRIIAATNADVDALVSQGRFRQDLFYRLNIVRLQIPPLRERRVEIPAFANHYLQKYAKEMHKGELRLAEETMEYLVLYRWPGNVRQLANEMRRLAALAETNAVLMPEHLSPDIAASRRTVPASDRTLEASEIVVRIDQPLSAATHHVERAMIHAAMTKTNSVDEAAKLLGLSRKGLYLKRLRFGMEIDRGKNDSEVA
jgi:DNA-binding NtrC family response regulator